MTSLILDKLTFKDIERIFFKIGCEVSKFLMQSFLEKMDKDLAEGRNKAELRHKGYRKTSIKTLMGEVELNRILYKRTKDDGSIEHKFLLDEALGFDSVGLISPNLIEKILDYSCEMSYREVSQAISNLTNQPLSHQGVWNIVQALGERQTEIENELIKANRNNELSGKQEAKVLFEEADGIWLSMQNKNRKKKVSRKKELKVSIVYEGWEKRYPSSKEYKTVGKMVFAGYLKPSEMKDLRDAAIAKKYNIDEIIYRILNGDGASWIKNGHDLEIDRFQLDPYHLSKSVVRNVSDKRARKNILRWLKSGEFEKVFKKIEDLKYESGGLEKEVKKLNALESYIKSNIDGIVPYKDRNDILLPLPPEGIEYRCLGTMERQIEAFAKRMKGAKSWSEKGATNLSKIIALKMCDGFKEKLAGLVSGKLPERFTDRFEEEIINTRQNLKKAAKKSVYPLHRGGIPYSNCKVTNGRKVIRNMFDLKPFSELTYR